MPQSVRYAAAMFAAITVAGAFAAPAHAATAGVASVVSTTKVQYKAAKGKQNKVVVTRSGKTITIDDKVAVKAGKGCKAVKGDKTKVRCTPSKAPTRLRIFTYDRNDSIVNSTDLGLTSDGGTGNDKIYGGPRADFIQGGSGADKIYGRGGKDELHGDDGSDRLSGGDGDDWLAAEDGNDVLLGDAGHDSFHGGNGNDRMYGGPGQDGFSLSPADYGSDNDYVSGGAGDRDAVTYITYTKGIKADADGVTGDDGAKGEKDTLATDIEEIQGGEGNDVLYGTARVDYLYGWSGNDVIYGLGGDDLVAGEAGQDKLYGGAGDDYVSGYDWTEPKGQDRLDGGTNGTAEGDLCEAHGGDAKVGCERS
ncbi:calcium-binding protein [Actinoplanes aureus]|uniref:Calcium-binding protein n=1 Tax=Actinoplanes aureus TaxID=2792083 RepID=A0A931FVG2_9ACTN|nr:calcium-binding protein [Actinoplanes aureus]MBG0560757.1 calcium-binding protein [Actinoplanes aureus]